MKKIAIIGASPNKERYSNKCIRAYLSKGFEVEVTNPKYEEIEGIKTTSLNKISAYTVSVYLRPDIFKYLINNLSNSIKKVYLNPGTESEEVIKMLKRRSIEPVLKCAIRAIGLNPDDF